MTTADVRAFLDHIERTNRSRQPPREVSQTTLAKHLRQLGACLEAAKAERLIGENPVRLLAASARPKVQKKRPSYFTNDELARLWPELKDRPAISYLCRLAVASGMRFGELAALRWADVNLLGGEVVVSRTYVPGIGEKRTKGGEPRTLDLTPQAKRLLEEWYAQTDGEGLVFAREAGGHQDGAQVLSVLYAAMERAHVPRIGERGGKRTFHDAGAKMVLDDYLRELRPLLPAAQKSVAARVSRTRCAHASPAQAVLVALCRTRASARQ